VSLRNGGILSTDPVESQFQAQVCSLDAAFLSQIVESIGDPVFVKDEQHRWVFLNQAFCEFIGFRREDLLGKSDYDFFPAEQADIFWEKDDLVFANGEINVNIEKATTSTNRLSILSTRKSILTDSRGNKFLLGIIRDITEAARRESHQEQIAQILKHLVLGASQEEILKIVLRAAEDALPGVIATILLLDPETQRLHPAISSKLPGEFSRAIDGTPARAGMGSCGEAAFRRRRVIVEDIATHPNWQRVRDLALKHDLRACWSQPVFTFSGEVAGTFALYFPQETAPEAFELEVLATLAQLTTIALEHHQIACETQNLRLLLSDIINAMPSLLIAVDHHGCVLQWNTQAEKMTGFSAAEAQGCKLETVLKLGADQLEGINQAVAEQQSLNWARIAHPWAEKNHWLDLTLYPVRSDREVASVIRIDDVTTQVRLEQMVVQTEKIHSLGGLTAGMAHEINNPLAGILQNIQIMKHRLQGGLKKNEEVAKACGGNIELIESYMRERKIADLMDMVIEAGERASNIVKNMLNFSRKDDMEIGQNNLPELMDKTLSLLNNDYNHAQGYDFRKVEICRDYQPDLPEVPSEGRKLQQVFFNLLKNAAQAMIAVKKPKIWVRIRVSSGWLQIEIEDNGPGMDRETQRHIFEPFYTTKPVGAGTGLGLSVSYFIVTRIHQGRMSVDSQINGGARFLLELPLGKIDSPENAHFEHIAR